MIQQKALVKRRGRVGLSEERSKRRKSSSKEITRIVCEQDRSEDFKTLRCEPDPNKKGTFHYLASFLNLSLATFQIDGDRRF
ncbi:hypothetical protein LWI29_000500 [Acer saccharum]|uniref:Uncharacterized protein n=1 Tax=Acer saccharum TaxID=4024 RepID=A0AA39VPT0_ACESA|nr:hypothetical protein LWI29_000500 [Acer saccharum]KAK1554708.1 hypothetical protein Q3G72_016143 [Acer saccharum]